MAITHSTVVEVADDGTSPVGSDEWNAAHTIADETITTAMLHPDARGITGPTGPTGSISIPGKRKFPNILPANYRPREISFLWKGGISSLFSMTGPFP